MFQQKLKSLLETKGFLPDNLREMERLCVEWFREEASLAAFVIASVMADVSLIWSVDEQAVESATLAPYEERLLPEIISFLSQSHNDMTAYSGLRAIVRALRECQRPIAARRE